MPRGSRPGERRGGRQKGTPNKKTLLRNAALSAAAADPNLSPLDHLLNVMRDQTLTLRGSNCRRTGSPALLSLEAARISRSPGDPSRYGDAFRGGNGGRADVKSLNIRIINGGLSSAARQSEPDAAQDNTLTDAPQKHGCPEAPENAGAATPLEFLLSVMRDPETPVHLRLRIASLLARYVHPKRSTDGASKIVVEDPSGFSIDPALAIELRDAKRRYDFVYITRISQPEHYQREAATLAARIKEIEQDLQCPCPSLYGKDQRKRDEERLKELQRVRHSGLKLSTHEDIEEAWLTARVASWSTIPECAACGASPRARRAALG